MALLVTHCRTEKPATWSDSDFNGGGKVDDADQAILSLHWMMTVEDMDDNDDAHDLIFAGIGATDDALGLYGE